MKFTEDEKVDLVLYFHVPISKDYKEWREYEPYRRFEEYGFAKEDNGQVELTPEGDEYLHKFIQTETEKIISLLKNRKELWLEQILEEVDYGEESREFIEYLIKNECYKDNSKIMASNVFNKKHGKTILVEKKR